MVRWVAISTALLAAGYAFNAVFSSAGMRGPADLSLLILFVLSLIFMLPISKRIAILPAIGSLVGFAFEYIGIKYGYPFGSYSYVKLEKPSFYGVPLPVIIAWGIYIYTCYLASTCLARGTRRAFIASLLMVLLDMAVDPVMVENGAWTWRESGLWFGIPLSNFLGWFLVSLIAIFMYHLLSRDDPAGNLPCYVHIPYVLSFLPILALSGQNSWIPAFISFFISISILPIRIMLKSSQGSPSSS